jgi:AAA family ATP:ADP antiporter
VLANDVYDPRQAKRVFGFIGGGASLGGTAGAGLTVWLAQPLGTDNLLLVSAACLALGAGLSWYLTRQTEVGARPAVAAPSDEQIGGKEALRLLRASRHLRLIALIIGFAAMGAVILEQQLNMATEAVVAEQDAITSFLASITLYISAIAFFVQIWLTGRIHRLLGVGVALLVLPVSLAITSFLILLFPVVWIAALARVQDSSLRYTLDKTSREILFLPLPADLKHKAKPFVDVAVDRLMGKGLASLLLLVLLKVFDFEWYQLSYLSLAMVGLWIVMAVGAKREYIAAFRRRLAQGDLSAADVALLTPDLSTLEVLVTELGSADEQRVLNAVDLLELLDKRQLVTPLLLQHRSAHVRARGLRAMAGIEREIAGEWLPAVELCLADDDPEVRAAALAALAAIQGAAARDVLRAHLNDSDAQIVAMAARALAESGRAEDVEAAERALARLSDDRRDAVARAAAARVIGESAHPRLRRLLVPLLSDTHEDVARTAIAAARRVIPPDVMFLPILVSLLGHRLLKQPARASLASYGPEGLPALGHFLTDPDESPWVRRHLPATVALIPCQESVDLLLTALDDADGFVRYKAMSALASLHRDRPELRIDPRPLEIRAFDEAVRATRYWRAYGDLFGADGHPETLLASALRQNVQRGVGP